MIEARPPAVTEELTGAWLRGLREGTTHPLLHLDAAATIRLATSAAADMLGRPRDDLVGITLADLAVPAQQDALRSLIGAVAADLSPPRSCDVVCLRPDGAEVHLEVTMVRSLGEHDYALALQLRDVSDARESGARDRKKLRWFQALTEHSGDVIVVADATGEHRFVSGSAPAVLGCAPEELTRQGWLDRIHPQDRGRVEKVIQELASYDGHERTVQCRVRHADGHFVHVETKGINQLSHPDVEGIVYYTRDVGDRILRDPVTGLPGRRLFNDRLDEVISERQRRAPFAVLLISLERHRQVKNGLGPRFADEMLAEFAERARHVMDDRAMLARLNDGELVALVDGIGSPEDANRLAGMLRKLCSAPFKLAGQSVHSEVHVGISLSTRGYTRSDAMLRDAGTALAGAAAGQGTTVANTHLIQRVSRRLILESDLRRALETESLLLHYQPIIALDTNRLEGFEALVRWKHPRRGLISPGLFVPLAEETGLISEIDTWVVGAAARQLHRWQRRIEGGADLYVHVNLSARAFQGDGPLESLQSAVETYELRSDQLRVELTESALVERPDEAADILTDLAKHGFHVALDDFGTGYSSLSYLSRFPFHSLKIDRAFVSGPSGLEASGRTLKLVRAIIELGRSLDLEVVAEGIENAVQADRLRAMGCTLAQGYFLGKPMPPPEARVLIEARPALPVDD